MALHKEIIGNKYGRLTVINILYLERSNKYRYYADCVCDCGKNHISRVGDVVSGTIKSCGCYGTELRTKHGRTFTSTFKTWDSMKDRCRNKNNKSFKWYGGRGITVCDRWMESFNNFYDDMGEKPDGYQIDRIDNDGNYEPNNCRWVTPRDNTRNKSTTKLNVKKVKEIKLLIRSADKSYVDISKLYGVTSQTIKDIKYGRSWKDINI